MSERIKRVEGLLVQEAGRFLNELATKQSLITVTKATVSKDLKNATVFISVFPEDQQDVALSFCNRKQLEFKNYIKPRLSMKRIPNVTFRIDYGEKNRQRIENLTSEF